MQSFSLSALSNYFTDVHTVKQNSPQKKRLAGGVLGPFAMSWKCCFNSIFKGYVMSHCSPSELTGADKKAVLAAKPVSSIFEVLGDKLFSFYLGFGSNV